MTVPVNTLPSKLETTRAPVAKRGPASTISSSVTSSITSPSSNSTVYSSPSLDASARAPMMPPEYTTPSSKVTPTRVPTAAAPFRIP